MTSESERSILYPQCVYMIYIIYTPIQNTLEEWDMFND